MSWLSQIWGIIKAEVMTRQDESGRLSYGELIA